MALREIPGQKHKNTISRTRGIFEGKNRHPQSFSQKARNFFTRCVSIDRTPRGGKSQNTGFLGPFGLGQPRGNKRNSGPGPKTEKHNFPELRALLGDNFGCPKIFSQKERNFLTFCVLTNRTPKGGKSQSTGFFGPFGLGQPLGT